MRGFVSPMVIGVVALAVVGGLLALQTMRLEGVKAEYAAFKANVKAVGEEAERKAKARELADKQNKEKADAENKTLRADNAALSRKLRDARARGGFVPAATPGARRPDIAPFDRAELERAIQRLDDGVSGIVEKGDQARIDLDSAKRWAKGVKSAP